MAARGGQFDNDNRAGLRRNASGRKPVRPTAANAIGPARSELFPRRIRPMSRPVFVIALDALSPVILEDWVRQGRAPLFARLMSEGAYGHLNKSLKYPHENSWSQFLYGATPDVTGQWGQMTFDPATYGFREFPAYADWGHGPFYAQDAGRTVVVLDLPGARIIPGLRGKQVLGWGTESNQFIRASAPPQLMFDITQRHGEHPAYSGLRAHRMGDAGTGEVLTFRNPSVYDVPALMDLRQSMIGGIRKRAEIIKELMREPWDLFLACFAEPHITGHLLWHLEFPHPLHDAMALDHEAGESLYKVYQALEESLAGILSEVPSDAHVVFFTPSGMRANASDALLAC
jgi:hypothetical protein